VRAGDLTTEIFARTLHQEAATHCHAVQDDLTRDLEEHYIAFVETQLDLSAARP
jgi:bacterioferritin